MHRPKGTQLAASVRFSVNIDNIARFFRLLLLPPSAESAAKACRKLPQVWHQQQSSGTCAGQKAVVCLLSMHHALAKRAARRSQKA